MINVSPRKPGLNSNGNHATVAEYDSDIWWHGGADQTPPLYVYHHIPGQEKLQGNSQLDFPNYTLYSPGSREGSVGSDPTGPELTLNLI